MIVEKGSIAIDGISLTVASVTAASFSVSIIPHTRAQTNLSTKRVGDVVNLENDCIGKYVERLLGDSGFLALEQSSSPSKASSGITKDFLFRNGF